MRIVTALCVCSLLLLSDSQAVRGSHPEDTYGPALASRRVDGIGPCQAVAVVGNRLYATGRGRFCVLDISVPDEPVSIGELSGLGNTRQIALKGTTAYVTARQDGLWLIDVSDSAAPRIISHYDTVEMATGISVSGTLAFVATRQYGVEIIDVSNPHEPRHVSTLKTGEAQSCWARDGMLYIGDWAPKKLVIADVRNPRRPAIIGEAILDGYGDGGCLRGKYCFAATGHHSRAKLKAARDGKGHGLEILDISNPQEPRFVSRVKFPTSYHISNDMWTARVSGDHCVVADTWNGLFVINVQDVTRPEIVAHAVLPPGPKDGAPDPVGGIALGSGVIYAAGIFTGLYSIPAPGLAAPVVPERDKAPTLTSTDNNAAEDSRFLTYRPDGQVRAVTVDGDIAWAACGKAGIQAIRLGESLKPVSVTMGQGEVFHLAVSGNRLYAAENAAGLAIYEIGPACRLTEIGRLRVRGRSVKQVACPAPGRFALFHCGSAAVQIADLSDPANPKVVLRDAQVGLFYGDQLVPQMMGDRYLVAHWHRSGPAWYDVSGDHPVHRGNSPDERLYSFADGACALGEKLLITKRGELQLLEPGEMREVSRLPAIAVAGRYLRGRPGTDGKRLALSRRPDRTVELFDISNIDEPKPIRDYRLTGHPGACRFWNARLVIPAGYGGLLVERPARDDVLEADVCVYGGTSGGVVAAVQAARMGKRVVLVEPGRHLGGLTAGGLSAVDIGDPRSVGGIAREYFSRLVASYGKTLNWGERFKGNGGPATGGAYSIEPHIAERVFDEMAAEAGVTVWREARLKSLQKVRSRVVELTCEDGRAVRGKMFIDTTYEGDLLAAAGVSYTLMREGNAKYGEQYNGIHYTEKYRPRTVHKQPGANGRVPGGQGVWDRDFPLDPYIVKGDPSSGLLPLINEGQPGQQGSPASGVMAYCFRLCLSTADDRLPIEPPPDYDPAHYELVARFIEACLAIGDDMDVRWFSKHDPLPNQKWDFNTATFGGNLPGASWEWPEASYDRRVKIAKDIENYHRGLLHFLRTDPRVPKKVRYDMSRFGLPRDEFTDNGGWPHQIYVREGRRMVSDLVLTEHHTFGRQIAPHSIGLGSYGTDVHEIRRIVKNGVVTREGKVAGGRGGFGPYQIGYGAIVPKSSECENLFATFALSASHTAFASIRMEPVFMATSQSAATAACLAMDTNVSVQKVNYDQLQKRLLADRQVLKWPRPGSGSKLDGIVLDDRAARFTGTWTRSNAQAAHVGLSYQHDANQKRGEKTATFSPVIPTTGDYDIRLLYTIHENRSSMTTVTIHSGDKEQTVLVNQREAPRSLGVFRLAAGQPLKVVVSNRGANGFVVVDGLQLKPIQKTESTKP